MCADAVKSSGSGSDRIDSRINARRGPWPSTATQRSLTIEIMMMHHARWNATPGIPASSAMREIRGCPKSAVSLQPRKKRTGVSSDSLEAHVGTPRVVKNRARQLVH